MEKLDNYIIKYSSSRFILRIKNVDEYKNISNKNDWFDEIIDEICNSKISSLEIRNSEFLDEYFLKKLELAHKIEDVYICCKCDNCSKVAALLKKNEINTLFWYEFDSKDDDYYNDKLVSFTVYPGGFNINSKEQVLTIGIDTSIDILIKLLKMYKQNTVEIEFEDTANFKRIIDTIDCNEIVLYINEHTTSEDIEYIRNKFPNAKFIVKQRTLNERDVAVTYDRIREKDLFLDTIINEVKKLNLSSFEQYMYLYSIVKKFKPYRETTGNYLESRSTYFIYDNNFIVCEGYANLLEQLVNKLNNPDVQCVKYGLDYEQDEIYYHHARNLVYIKDTKYGLNGIFVADPTWDSVNSHKSARLKGQFDGDDKLYDWYNHIILTPEQIESEEAIDIKDDMFLKIYNCTFKFEELGTENRKSICKFLNGNVKEINKLIITSVPNDIIKKSIYEIYKIIYANFADEMFEDTISSNRRMNEILFNKSKSR